MNLSTVADNLTDAITKKKKNYLGVSVILIPIVNTRN